MLDCDFGRGLCCLGFDLEVDVDMMGCEIP